MLLTPSDVEIFFRLHKSFMFFVNQRLRVVPDDLADPHDFAALPPEARLKVRDAFVNHPDLVESFVHENPTGLSSDELEIVRSWRHAVAGRFFVFRGLKKYTVFLGQDEPPIAYGVLALTQPFEELIGPYLPVFVQTVLLPFKGMIVYDGLISPYSITFGAGIRRSLNESFKEAKARYGITTSLPVSANPIRAVAPVPKRNLRPTTKPQAADVLAIIVGMIDPFCRDHLNEEYTVLCRRLAEKLARKRPSPLLSGRPNSWASAIIRTIGWVNFLHDPSQTPSMRLGAIDAAFGISESSGAAKSKAIRTILRIRQFDPQWTLPSRMDDNPLVWTLMVNGLLMDVRYAPREVQEIAFEKGLIPYIPADRQG